MRSWQPVSDLSVSPCLSAQALDKKVARVRVGGSNVIMKKLHAALGVEARTYMHKLYVVHPNFMLRAHLTLLATVEPIYRCKVQYVETVRLSSRPARARAPLTARPARP